MNYDRYGIPAVASEQLRNVMTPVVYDYMTQRPFGWNDFSYDALQTLHTVYRKALIDGDMIDDVCVEAGMLITSTSRNSKFPAPLNDSTVEGYGIVYAEGTGSFKKQAIGCEIFALGVNDATSRAWHDNDDTIAILQGTISRGKIWTAQVAPTVNCPNAEWLHKVVAVGVAKVVAGASLSAMARELE